MPYKNKELGRILKREYYERRRMRPEVREKENEEERRRYWQKIERIKATFGVVRSSAKSLDRQQELFDRAAKILSGDYVLSSSERKNAKERRNAKAREYRARPEVREKLQEYDRRRSQNPERKLANRRYYQRNQEKIKSQVREYRARPENKEKLRESNRIRNQLPKRKLMRKRYAKVNRLKVNEWNRKRYWRKKGIILE